MTRGQAILHHAAKKRSVKRLHNRNLLLKKQIETLLQLKVRRTDNPPALLAKVAKIARKHLPAA